MLATDHLKVVQKYLQVLGVDPEATVVYVELSRSGPTSALQLSKQTGISRTQIYRRLEELQTAGLANVEQLQYGSLFSALSFGNIEALIARREAETAASKASLDGMVELLQQLAGGDGPKATVKQYYGKAGLKQAYWNLSNATKEFQIFEAGPSSAANYFDAADKAFAQRLRQRCLERKLSSRILTNRTNTDDQALKPFEPSSTSFRRLDPEIMTISYTIYIYDDCVTLLNYTEAQQTAVEFQHPALYTMMRQLFDAMWNIATPFEIK